MTDVYTMNLSENSDGMVNLNNNKSTNFIEIMNQILYLQLHFLPASATTNAEYFARKKSK